MVRTETTPLPALTPLADRMRPASFDEFVGQEHLLAKGKVLRALIERDEVPSMVLWGPPGSGKTSLAQVIAQVTKSRFVSFSAVTGNVKQLREIIETARKLLEYNRERTIVFVDEIHRFNKAQQDAFLPHVERGTITLIGATTENPSFEVIGPLLSRSRVFVLEKLGPEHVGAILKRALTDRTRGFGRAKVRVGKPALALLIDSSGGDARIALNTLELVVKATKSADGAIHVTQESVRDALQRSHLLYDKHGEEHYNIISAFIKSIRGSDPDAGLYWLARMLEGGEDPLFIARRLVILASEDIGNADPRALPLAVAAFQAVERIGLPEARLTLAQCVTFLATAPKDNASYIGLEEASRDVREHPNEPVPLNLRNAPTKLMKDLGYGADYKYSHDYEPGSDDGKQEYLPEKLRGKRYYHSRGKN